jgi:hypothetical protein
MNILSATIGTRFGKRYYGFVNVYTSVRINRVYKISGLFGIYPTIKVGYAM